MAVVARKQQAPNALDQSRALLHAFDAVAWAADTMGWNCDEWQADFLRSKDKRICMVCSRRSGKSASTGLLAAHTAIFRPGSTTVIVCPSERQSTEMLRT